MATCLHYCDCFILKEHTNCSFGYIKVRNYKKMSFKEKLFHWEKKIYWVWNSIQKPIISQRIILPFLWIWFFLRDRRKCNHHEKWTGYIILCKHQIYLQEFSPILVPCLEASRIYLLLWLDEYVHESGHVHFY